MAYFDLPLEELREYRPDNPEPLDLDDFWAETLSQNAFDPSKVWAERVDTCLELVDVWDVRFPGFGGEAIKAWLVVPNSDGPVPAVVVEFIGYGGGRGLPTDHLVWATAGYAHLVVDSRGQGGTWGSGGDTPDGGPVSASHPGVMTRGIQDPRDYYYRRLFTDAHHATLAAGILEPVGGAPVVVTGASQGGALALAAASLNRNVEAVMADVPFLCNFPRSIGLTAEFPYQEIVEYLAVKRDEVGRVFDTLAYFDCVNLVKRCTAPALFSTALMDETAPPSSVFAAKNAYGGRSEIEVYPFNGHEGGGGYQLATQLEWLVATLDEASC